MIINLTESERSRLLYLEAMINRHPNRLDQLIEIVEKNQSNSEQFKLALQVYKNEQILK